MVQWIWYGSVTIYCILGTSLAQLTDETGPVRNFTCITYNWNNVACQWNYSENVTPDHVDVKWKPSILFIHPRTWYRCPKQTKTSCRWDIFNESIDIERKYKIKVTVNNQNYSIFSRRWNESVQPNPVEELSAIHKNVSCVFVKWRHSDNIHNKIYTIQYKRDHFQEIKEKMVISYDDSVKTDICDLKPFTKYYIKVSCKPKRGGYWSTSEQTTIVTQRAVPSSPPDISAGGFSWRQGKYGFMKELTIYMETLEPSKWNAEVVDYDVQIVGDKTNSLKSTRDFSVEFEVEEDTSYHIKLSSRNVVGSSSSRLKVVPPFNAVQIVKGILAIKNHTQNEIVLFWKPPAAKNVQFYSLFWCEHAFGDVCKNQPSSKQVDGVHNNSIVPGLFTKSTSYLFGVSYTSRDNVTSGFIWSDCYIDFTSNVIPISLGITLHPQKDAVLVKWWFTKCSFVAEMQFIDTYQLHICSYRNCKDYSENNISSTANFTFLPLINKEICVRILPLWKGGIGLPSETVCLDLTDKKGTLLSILLSVGAFCAFLAVFGCCMIMKKVGRVVKKVKQPYIIETPIINNNRAVPHGESGHPLLTTS